MGFSKGGVVVVVDSTVKFGSQREGFYSQNA
jgi:hypothetical protein